MDNEDKQTEQDKTKMYLRTSTEEEQKPLTWEEYDEDEPFEEDDKDEPFEENDDKGSWTTQFSYPTEEEENALFIAFMTGNVEDQKTWINAKMNLTRTQTNEETRRREKEILDRIIPKEIMDLDRDFDEEETDNLPEYQIDNPTRNQEEDFASIKPNEFIDEDPEEDIQPLESFKASYQDHQREDKGTIKNDNPLSLISKLDDQLEGAEYFTELDMHWKYDNEHITDEDQWKENFETNQMLFEPTTIFSCPYSPMISQAMIEEIFQDKQNEQRIIVNKDYDIQTKEQDTENTQCVLRQSRDNNLFPRPDECTPWVTRTEYKGLLNPENQLQTNPMKPYDIDIWPTPAMTTEAKSFLGFGNVDKGFIQDNWTLTEPFKELLEADYFHSRTLPVTLPTSDSR